MKVSLLNTTYTNYPAQSISFGDNCVKSPNKYQPNLHTHYTYLGRGHFDREKLVNRAIELIRNKENVEFLFCGCSDGSEVFEMAMELKDQFDKKGISMEKFPKIKAFDINPELIKIAKSGRINVSENGIEYVKNLYPEYNFLTGKAPVVKIESDNLNYLAKTSNLVINSSYQFDKNLLDKIEFYTGDMLKEFKTIDSKSCKIVFCRNVARYNSKETQLQAARELAKRLKHNSLVVVGVRDEYDIVTKSTHPLCSRDYKSLPFVEELNKTNFTHRYDLSEIGTIYQKITFLPKNKLLRAIVKLFKRI